MNDLLSVPQAARRLGLKPAMVRRHCQNGTLKATKVGSRWVIHETDVKAFAAIPRRRGPKPR
jgi:excisionase family DNA binding protein